MTVLHIAGVDPGLIHTGVVVIHLDTDRLRLTTTTHVVSGPDALAVASWLASMGSPKVFIEKYRPRAHYGTDTEMVQAERDFMKAMPDAKLLSNTGIKTVVTDQLMQLLELWSFKTPTHHQDLRSAARIALLGMLKHPEMNKALTQYVLHKDANG